MINTEEKTLTAQKMKFSIKDFLGKYDQIRRKLKIWRNPRWTTSLFMQCLKVSVCVTIAED